MPEAVVTRRKKVAVSDSAGGGKSTAQLVRESNEWRDTYNPLRGLVIAKAITLIEAAERGDFAELQLVMRKVERRYPVLKGLKARRLAAIESLDWNIKTIDEKKLPEGATKAMADKQTKHLRSRYELIQNLTESFGRLVLAEFRGFTILQKHRYDEGPNDGAVRELHWLPQDQFARAGRFGDFFYNKNSRFGVGGSGAKQSLGEANRIGGEELPRSEFLLREVEDPLFEIALIAFINFLLGRKDWAAFIEIFGLAKGVVTMPPNIPKGKEDEYLTSAVRVSNGNPGAIPHGSSVTFPTSAVRGEAPFKSFCEAQDSDVVLAGTGGRLSMLTAEKGGLGDGPAEEHADAFDKIAQADARKINEIFQRDFDKLELEAEFPGEPILAYFELSAVEEEDANSLTDRVQKLENVGLQTDPAEVGEKVGLKLTRGVKPTLPGQPPTNENPQPGNPRLTNRAGNLVEQEFIAAVAEKRDPVLALLNRITDIKDDAQMVATLNQFLAHADAITAAVTADVTRAATALEQITAPALAAGLAGKNS